MFKAQKLEQATGVDILHILEGYRNTDIDRNKDKIKTKYSTKKMQWGQYKDGHYDTGQNEVLDPGKIAIKP